MQGIASVCYLKTQNVVFSDRGCVMMANIFYFTPALHLLYGELALNLSG